MLRTLGLTFRVAFRHLLRTPRFTAFCVLTIGISVGFGTALYSVVHATLFRPAPLPHLDRLVNLYHANPRVRGGVPSLGFSSLDFHDFASQQTQFAQVAGYSSFNHPIAVEQFVLPIRGEAVTGSYFTVVGIQPIAGRILSESDDLPSSPDVAVISEAIWHSILGRRQGVIGTLITLRGRPFEIVGVVPATYPGQFVGELLPTKLWIPSKAAAQLFDRDPLDRNARWLLGIGLLKNSGGLAQAQTELSQLANRLDQTEPLWRPGNRRLPQKRQWTAVPTREIRFHGQDSRFFRPLANGVIAAALIVLFVACTNLSSLILASQSAREGERATKLALGASRGTLVGEQLMETALLATAGGVVALGVATIMMAVFRSQISLSTDVVIRFQPRMEAAVFAAAMVGTICAMLVVALVPAYRAGQVLPRESLQSAASPSVTAPWRSRRWLVAAQVTASVLFLSLAAQAGSNLFRSKRAQLSVLDDLAVVRLTPIKPDGSTDPRRLATALKQAGLARDEAHLAIATGIPGVLSGSIGRFDYAGGSAPISVDVFVTSPDLFLTLNLSPMKGTAFRDESMSPTRLAECVLSERAALAAFGTARGLGELITVTPEVGNPPQQCRIVGIVADVGGPRTAVAGALYTPFSEHHKGDLLIVARASEANELAGLIASAVPRLEPTLATIYSGTGTAAAGPQTLVMRASMALTGWLGLLSLALAVFGIYSVMSHVAMARRREIGLRLALGGSQDQIMWMMLRQGFEPVVMGATIGTIFALTALYVLSKQVSGEFRVDYAVLVLLPLFVMGVALVGCLVPVRRAITVSPATTLRSL